MNAEQPTNAEQAATWMINLEDSAERNRLYRGHLSRRIPTTDTMGFRATDHRAADEWLVEQWQAATAPTPEPVLLVQVQEELSRKFTGDIYTASAVLTKWDSKTQESVWRIEYTLRSSGGLRVPAFDGLIRRTASGVTYAL